MSSSTPLPIDVAPAAAHRADAADPITPRTRPALARLVAYRPGRTPEDVAREVGVARAVKLASNELPGGPLPGVVAAVAAAAATADRYPDNGATGLVADLAAYLDVPAERVVVGPGSVALCQGLLQATCDAGDEVVTAWRSFEAYPLLATVVGAQHRAVPLVDGRHDLAAMAAAIGPRTRLVFLCTPNNPTGPAISQGDLLAFLDAVPGDVVVVLDEAYAEFVTDPDAADGVVAAGLRGEAPRANVVVLRTLSKAWALAGLRVGYAIAPEPLADVLRRVHVPFSVSVVAQAAGRAALAAVEEMRVRVADVVAERDRVRGALRTLGVDVPPTQGNFVWLPLGEGAAAFAAACERRGVIVRAFAGEGVRVTIGSAADNDLFLAAAVTELAGGR